MLVDIYILGDNSIKYLKECDKLFKEIRNDIGLSRKDLYGLFFFYIFIYNIKLKKHDISFI